MRKTIQQAVLAGLIAATVMPVAAQAQMELNRIRRRITSNGMCQYMPLKIE